MYCSCVLLTTVAKSLRRAAPRAAVTVSDGRWSPKEAAEYAAQRDFRLCQLLATDRRAFAVARQLGLGPQVARGPQSQALGASPPPASSGGRQRGVAPTRAPSKPNHAQRRSAARSAKKHAALNSWQIRIVGVAMRSLMCDTSFENKYQL